MGRKIERIRKIKDIKQETLATALGISRQSLSKVEQSEQVDDDKLEAIAKALGVTSDFIKNFSDEAIINNNIYDQNNTVINYNFNPIEKIVELYERILNLEKEKNDLLQKLLEEKKR